MTTSIIALGCIALLAVIVYKAFTSASFFDDKSTYYTLHLALCSCKTISAQNQAKMCVVSTAQHSESRGWEVLKTFSVKKYPYRLSQGETIEAVYDNGVHQSGVRL